MRAVDIFIAYSHNDLRHKDELKKFLRPLLNTGLARIWDDYEIEGGQDWEAEIKKRLYGADIILLLVSPDSLASEYFYGHEVKVSLERHDKGEASVVPVILRPCAWTITPLKRLEALPEKGRPVTSWASQDEAYTDIAHSIGNIVESRQTVLAAATLQEDQRRDFTAAAEAAEHLFRKKQWEEARKAFASALQLHRPGFLPDRTALENFMASCTLELKQAAQAAEQEAQQKEYESILDAADYTEDPRQVAQILQKAIQLYQPGFPGSVEALRQRLHALQQKPPAHAAQQQSGSVQASFNTRPLLIAAAGVGLLLLLFFVFRQFNGNNNKTDINKLKEQMEKSKPGEAYPDPESATTIPALQQWLNDYPHADSKERTNARNRLQTLQNKRDRDIADAKTAIRHNDFTEAENIIQTVMQTSPDDKEALSLWKQIPHVKK